MPSKEPIMPLRLTAEDRRLLSELAAALAREKGVRVSRSDALRLALREMHARLAPPK